MKILCCGVLILMAVRADAWAKEFTCPRFGFSLDVPTDVYAPVQGGDDWLRFEARDGSGASVEFMGIENMYYPLEDFVIYHIKPGMTLLKAEKIYGGPEQELKYDLYELAYERDGFVEVVITKDVYWQKSKDRFIYTAHYIVPSDKYERYKPIIEKINASWKLYETKESDEE